MTYTISNWNTYQIKDGAERGNLVIRLNVEAENVTAALDYAATLAANWNSNVSDEKRVNFVTCYGFIRTC